MLAIALETALLLALAVPFLFPEARGLLPAWLWLALTAMLAALRLRLADRSHPVRRRVASETAPSVRELPAARRPGGGKLRSRREGRWSRSRSRSRTRAAAS